MRKYFNIGLVSNDSPERSDLNHILFSIYFDVTIKRIKFQFILATVSLIFSGCFQAIAIQTMAGIMDYGFEAFNEESDTELAKEALGSNLKLIEALIKGDPENEKLLLYASQGYNAYALAFVEDDSVERARPLYLRARDFGLRILAENSA